jgi:hypothetical protein
VALAQSRRLKWASLPTSLHINCLNIGILLSSMSTSALARAKPLGPQCGKCRRRRVKCDSGLPYCQRCRRDGISCPGYATRKQIWTVATPSNIHDIVPKTNTKQSCTAVTSVWDADEYILPEPWKAILPLLNRASHLAMPDDIMLRQFDEALAYWSTQIRPTFAGCPIGGQPRKMTRQEWIALPRIMQHCVASVASCHQIASGYQAKTIETNLHAHSGCALAMLRGFLEDWERAPFWSGIVLVIMMCTIEVMRASGGPNAVWQVHFEAAWQLVALQASSEQKQVTSATMPKLGPEAVRLSGLGRSWKEGLESEMSCTYLLQIEVFSATTCSDPGLKRRPGILEALEPGVIEGLHTTSTVDGRLTKNQIWSEHWKPGVLQGLQDRLLLTPAPCPLAVMKAIAQVNDLRFSLYQCGRTDQFKVPATKSADFSRELWSILTTLLSFDASAWVADVGSRHRPKGWSSSASSEGAGPSATPPSSVSTPSTMASSNSSATDHTQWHRAWLALAKAYRSAALVYFVRAFSTSSALKARFPIIHRDMRSATLSIAANHSEILHRELNFLTHRHMCSFGIHTEEGLEDGGEIAHQLSRFLSWPLFVDGYETTAWSSGSANEQLKLEKITRLEKLGRLYGSGCMVDAASLLRDTKQKLMVRTQLGGGQTWHWEDAFESRWIFAV